MYSVFVGCHAELSSENSYLLSLLFRFLLVCDSVLILSRFLKCWVVHGPLQFRLDVQE